MRILVVGPSWVGDMVMAQSLFMCLQQVHPGAIIDVLAPDWCRDLLQRMPEVHAALPMPIGHGELALGLRRHIGKQLRSAQYQQAIVLPNSFKSALIPWFAGIPQRTGWRGEARGWLLNDCRRLEKHTWPRMVQRFAALAYAPAAPLPADLPQPALQTDPTTRKLLRERFGLLAASPVVALCPGAEFGPAKQWPARHYAALASALLREGKQLWLFGSTRDAGVSAEIISAIDPDLRANCFDLCGRTTLDQAIDLLAESSLVVSNDSGLMHIGAALGRPLVVLYGSTSASFTPPLTSKARLLSLDLPCSPCFKRECPLQHLDCLNKLEPMRALAAVHELLEREPGN
jgi:heptosyltransferase II